MSISTNGGALDLTGVGTPTVSVVLGGTTSTGGAKNVNLVGLNGTFTLASGALSGATGNGLDVNGGNAGITYSGTISNSGGRQVSIVSKTSGTVALSGAVSGTGTGIFLNANGTSIINFTGGMALSTGANNAFTATGGGTVTATQNNTTIVNTLTTTTGTALNVANTTIGASGTTFRSISAGTGAGSAGNGIILDTTGSSGGLTVTGNSSGLCGGDVTGTANPGPLTVTAPNAADCTGGTIQHKTGADASFATLGTGIYLNSTSNVSLTRMQLNDFDNFAIRGTSVTGFTLNNSDISGTNGNNDLTDEDSVRFINLLGSATVAHSTISGGWEDTFFVQNNTGTLDRLSVTNSLIGLNSTSFGNDGFHFETVTSAGNTMKLTVDTCRFLGARGDDIDVIAQIGTTLGVTFNNNSLVNQHTNSVGGGSIFHGGATATFNITGNNLSGSVGGTEINVSKNATAGIHNVTISNNLTGTTSNTKSGGNNGIFVDGGGAGSMTVLVTGNTVRDYGNVGIYFVANNQTVSGNNASLNATVTGNTAIGFSGAGTQVLAGIFTDISSGLNNDTTSACVDIGGAAALRNDFSLGDPANGSDIDVSTNENATYRMPGYGGTPLDFAAVGAYLTGRNLNPGTTSTNVNTGVTHGYTGGAACTQPNMAAARLNIKSDRLDHFAKNGGEPNGQSPMATSEYAFARAESSIRTPIARTPESAKAVKHAASSARNSSLIRKVTQKASAEEVARIYRSERPLSNHAVRRNFNTSAQKQNAPTSGENVTLNTIATFPAGGKSITIKYSATVNTPPLARSVSTQGTVTANAGAISVLTDDPEPGGATDPTVTLVDTSMTWNGSTSTDWNTATNWTQPAGGTQYAPGVANPAINDVVIPNVGNQPNISATDIGVFSLNISNGRTLTITSPRVLTIGGSPGGDLTLDGIISGGSLNLGTGTHVINNAGGTGSLSSTNMATVLSGSTVTLNNNLQAGALGVSAGGSMNITNRTLSLNGTFGLVVAGGVTFTTTGSTVIFNGTAVQQAAGIAYNNLTINNTTGLNVTGVTLIGNATVNGTLTLTSSDLATGAFTLTQPNTTASTGVSDVVGTVMRTGGPFPAATALTFGNPNNRITFAVAVTNPTTVTVLLAKAPPATYTVAVQRNYTISTTGSNTSTATVRLHYLDSEVTGLNTEATLNLRRLRTSDSHWVAQIPDTVDTSNNFVETTGSTVVGTNLPTQWTFSSLAPTAAPAGISGRITDSNGRPVEGAVVRLGGAQNRKFITDANGYYRFDNVETGSFYTVTPARENFNFTPFNRSFSQEGNQTEAVFTAQSIGDHANPLDTAEYFVRQQYVDVLGREPDENGFNYWSDRILTCGEDALCVTAQRREVAAAFFISAENQATGSYIYDAYAGVLGRRPAYGEYKVDRQQVVGGDNMDTAKIAFAQNFVQRAEFVARYQNATSADAFVDALMQSVQASGADLSGERSNLIASYNQAGGDLVTSRAAVVRSLADNAAFKQSQYNRAFVLTEYYAYLRRDVDEGGYNFWVQVLNVGDAGNYRGMVCSFTTSAEYQNRFSTVVSHTNGECSGQ